MTNRQRRATYAWLRRIVWRLHNGVGLRAFEIQDFVQGVLDISDDAACIYVETRLARMAGDSKTGCAPNSFH